MWLELKVEERFWNVGFQLCKTWTALALQHVIQKILGTGVLPKHLGQKRMKRKAALRLG